MNLKKFITTPVIYKKTKQKNPKKLGVSLKEREGLFYLS
jgi:hypothetical protein